MDSDALYKTWRKYSSVLFSTFEKKPKISLRMWQWLCWSQQEHLVHVQCWAMFVGGQANLCWKQEAMPHAVRFNRYVQHETRDTPYCPISSQAVCMLEIIFNTVIHQMITYSATAPAKGNLFFTHSFKILNTNIEPFNHGLALPGGVGVGVHVTAIAAGTRHCVKWPNSTKTITQTTATAEFATHHLITMEQIQLRGSFLPVLGKDCKWNDSFIYLYAV